MARHVREVAEGIPACCSPAMANHGPKASARRSGRPGQPGPHDAAEALRAQIAQGPRVGEASVFAGTAALAADGPVQRRHRIDDLFGAGDKVVLRWTHEWDLAGLIQQLS